MRTDPEMQEQIERTFSSGNASYEVSISVHPLLSIFFFRYIFKYTSNGSLDLTALYVPQSD